jgi:hypothetical protein
MRALSTEANWWVLCGKGHGRSCVADPALCALRRPLQALLLPLGAISPPRPSVSHDRVLQLEAAPPHAPDPHHIPRAQGHPRGHRSSHRRRALRRLPLRQKGCAEARKGASCAVGESRASSLSHRPTPLISLRGCFCVSRLKAAAAAPIHPPTQPTRPTQPPAPPRPLSWPSPCPSRTQRSATGGWPRGCPWRSRRGATSRGPSRTSCAWGTPTP